MIKKSFLFLPRIGEQKELQIKTQGINDWNDFINAEKIRGISKKVKGYCDRKLRQAGKALKEYNSKYFYGVLKSRHSWILYDYFKDDAVFLDIESSGAEKDAYMTVIGLSNGLDTKTMVKGLNFSVNELKKELQKYSLIVTFNGAVFDIPFLNRRYSKLLPKIPHIDLRYCCAKAGYAGGLKEIEKKLGIKRKNCSVDKMYSGDPLLLWRKWRATGDDYFLKLLVEYNEEDTLNLKRVSDIVIKKLGENYLKDAL